MEKCKKVDLSNNYIVCYYSERFIANVTVVFYEPYSSYSVRYVWLCSFLKMHAVV